MAKTTRREIEDRIRRMTPVSAPIDQREEVAELSRLLDRVGRGSVWRIVGPEGESTPIPHTVLCAFERVAELLGRGDAITVVPVSEELTTQQAADILNVSRQYVVRLLNEGRLPCTRVGKHRRIPVGALLSFKGERDRERRAALDRLTQLSEEAGGYSEMG